ncbi:hypothetical protein [Hymenobacter tenuis]
MPATPQPQTRAQLQAELERLITDELNYQNTAVRVRTVLGSRDLSFWNKEDDLIPIAHLDGLVGATGQLLINLLPPPNARPGGPFFLDHWLLEQEEPLVPSSLQRLPSNLLCIGCEINIRLGEEAGRYEVVMAEGEDASLLVHPDGYFRAGATLVPATIVRQVGGTGDLSDYLRNDEPVPEELLPIVAFEPTQFALNEAQQISILLIDGGTPGFQGPRTKNPYL